MVKVTQNVAQYPPHHKPYAHAKFEVALPMVKEKMHLQENTLFDLDLGGQSKVHYLTFDLDLGGQGHTKSHPVPSTSCDLYIYKV